MGYSIGFSNGRDIGYGVIATCDQPKCDKKIDRGMAYCCGEFRNDNACGLYFCSEHLYYGDSTQLCDRCLHNEELGDDAPYDKYQSPYEPKPDHSEWLYWKLNHQSWSEWRENHPEEVAAIDKRLLEEKYKPSKELEEMLDDSWEDQ